MASLVYEGEIGVVVVWLSSLMFEGYSNLACLTLSKSSHPAIEDSRYNGHHVTIVRYNGSRL